MTASNTEARSRYYDRVAPVVGGSLRDRCVAVKGGPLLSRALTALGRTGVRRFVVADGDADFAAALGETLSAHNGWEAYQVDTASGADADQMLALAAGPQPVRGEEVLATARERGQPAVIGWLLEQGPARRARLVWLPEMEAIAGLGDALSARARQLDGFRQASPASRFVDWLDLNALVLSAAQHVLLRGGERAAPELDVLWLQERRPLLLHGNTGWPWATHYPDPTTPLPEAGVGAEPVLPPALTARARILVLGCGTASLMLGEATRFFRTLVMCDAKSFSVFNPVRQLCSTDDVDGDLKPFVLQRTLSARVDARAKAPVSWEDEAGDIVRWRRGGGYAFGGAELLLKQRQAASVTRYRQILDEAQPDVVVVAMGRSRDDNFTACEILRARGILHIVPTAFPGVTHFKHIVVDGDRGPCYACLQNRLPVDTGPAPELQPQARELFYGGTQPATLAETLPSAYGLLRLTIALALPAAARPRWFTRALHSERTCFVGANRALLRDGEWLYGVPLPHQMVTYGTADVQVGVDSHCPTCGRPLGSTTAGEPPP